MNKRIKGSFIIFSTVFFISYGSQVPQQHCVDALLTIGNFVQGNSANLGWYISLYEKFAIPYNEQDKLFVCLKSVKIQEYNGLSVTSWLHFVPCISPLRKGLVKAIPLSDSIFPWYVPARWLVDMNGAVREDISLEFANGTRKVNFTVFIATDVVRELVSSDNNFFTLMQKRREMEARKLQERKEQDAQMAYLLRSI